MPNNCDECLYTKTCQRWHRLLYDEIEFHIDEQPTIKTFKRRSLNGDIKIER